MEMRACILFLLVGASATMATGSPDSVKSLILPAEMVSAPLDSLVVTLSLSPRLRSDRFLAGDIRLDNPNENLFCRVPLDLNPCRGQISIEWEGRENGSSSPCAIGTAIDSLKSIDLVPHSFYGVTVRLPFLDRDARFPNGDWTYNSWPPGHYRIRVTVSWMSIRANAVRCGPLSPSSSEAPRARTDSSPWVEFDVVPR
jgi:hypothetical protein